MTYAIARRRLIGGLGCGVGLQALLAFAYYVMRFGGVLSSDRD